MRSIRSVYRLSIPLVLVVAGCNKKEPESFDEISSKQTVYEQIRAEVLKPVSTTDRPLPLAAVWCGGPSSVARDIVYQQTKQVTCPGSSPRAWYSNVEGGAVDLTAQLAIINGTHPKFELGKNHHLLPTVDFDLPAGENLPTDYVWKLHSAFQYGGLTGAAAELALLSDLMMTPMQQLALQQLPLTAKHDQPEDMVDKTHTPTSTWAAAAKNDLYHCPSYNSRDGGRNDGCNISPFMASTVTAATRYKQMGAKLATKNQLQKYQEWYPNPPALIFLNNNEPAIDSHWLDATIGAPYAPALTSTTWNLASNISPGHDVNSAVKAGVDFAWLNVYNNLKVGFAENLQSARWGSSNIQRRHIAYSSGSHTFADHRTNLEFKPDLHTWIPCCAATESANDYQACRTAVSAGRACYNASHAMCASTDMNLGTGCYRAANPRADRAVVSNEVLSLINTGNLYYNYDYNDPQWAWLLAQQRRAFQFSTSSWPLSETPTNLPRPPLAVDKAFRAWDGTSFVGGWPHEEANYMNGNFLLSVGYDQLVMDQAIYTAYPNFWAETYSVTNPDTIGAELENQCTNNGQNVTAVLNNHTYLRDYGRARARSVSQLQLWMHRPRVVRNFDVCQGGGNKLNYTAPFLQADLDAVDAIWDDTTLQSFWKSSELVENAAYTTMFRTRGVRPFQSDWNAYPSRYWFLETDREKGTSSPPTGFIGFKSGATLDLNPITNMTDVVAIARVQTSPTKRYLVYAFTQTPATQKRVKITVPGALFSNLYVDVDQGGSFFVVNDPASLSLASVTTLSPASVPVSTSDFTLTINGSNFYPGSVVKMGTTALTTTYVSPGQLKAVVTDADATVGSHNITVVNPGPGASPSSTLTVTN